jgi:hypothetical protein
MREPGKTNLRAVTKLTDNNVPDKVYEDTRKQFSEEELVDLILAVIAINSLFVLILLFVYRREITKWVCMQFTSNRTKSGSLGKSSAFLKGRYEGLQLLICFIPFLY